MDINLNETVTLSIAHYEEMKEELKLLRQQVQEKTIVKEVPNPILLSLSIAVLLILLFLLVHVR